MRKSILFLSVLMPVLASASVDISQLSCQDVRNLVQRDGTVNVHYAKSNTLRLVSDKSYCFSGQDMQQGWLPTNDAKHCPAGFYCTDFGDRPFALHIEAEENK